MAFKTAYVKEMSIQTRDTCLQSIKRLEEEKEILITAHISRLLGLEARIKSCQEIVDRTNSELAAEK